MTFYSGLRDDTAAPLIKQFGQPATYRVYGAGIYDNDTGTTLKGVPTDLPIQLLDLPLDKRDFSEEVTAKANAKFLVEAASFAAANVVPASEATIVLRGKDYRVLAVVPVGPSGEAVIFKMAVQNA